MSDPGPGHSLQETLRETTNSACAPVPAVLAVEGRSLRRTTPLWTLKALQFLDTAAWACLGRFITVFYSEIGVSREHIGVLQFLGLLLSFIGQFVWSAVIDHRGEYKVTLVSTTVLGTAAAFCHLLPPVQRSYPLLLLASASFNFLCTGGAIIDALCLTVLSSQNVTEEDYGDQRLWCAVGWGLMSLAAGQLIDWFGLPFMFVGFAAMQALNLLIFIVWIQATPNQTDRSADTSVSRSSFLGSLLRADVCWFLLNVLQYGIAMSLVENFLLLFLLEDFVNTPKVLLGASVTVMCASEVPVFKYAGRLWNRFGISLPGVITACQALLALRCLLYTLLPPGNPWLVLLIEPLHGITFAAMWAATVEYGQRVAPPGATARMQALVTGVYEKAAMGLGSIVWGTAMEHPPKGLGFPKCFEIDAWCVVGWSIVWRLGQLAIARRGAG